MKTSTKFIIGITIAFMLTLLALIYFISNPKIEYISVYHTNTVYKLSNVYRLTNIPSSFPVYITNSNHQFTFNITNFVALTNIYSDYSNYEVLPILLSRSNEYILAVHYHAFAQYYDPPIFISNGITNFKNSISLYYGIGNKMNLTYDRTLLQFNKFSLGVGAIMSVDWDGQLNDSSAGLGLNTRF